MAIKNREKGFSLSFLKIKKIQKEDNKTKKFGNVEI